MATDEAAPAEENGNGKTPQGMISLRMTEADHAVMLGLKHRWEAAEGRVMSVADVLKRAMRHAAGLMSGPVDTPVQLHKPALEEPAEPEAPAKPKRHANKRQPRKNY